MNLPAPRRLFRSEPATSIERLEPRIAPASLTFTEADGDTVTITTSKGTLSSDAGGNVVIVDWNPAGTRPHGRRLPGSDVTITTKDGAAGMRDGLVKVGRIKADGRDLGEVKIKGDLGQIDAGDADPKTDGVKSLEVESLGKSGTDTQAAGGDLKSESRGRLGKLKVKTDVKEATLDVIGEANGRIGKIEIGGNLTGGAADGSGAIRATGSIDSVSIGGNLEGSGGANSGQIQTSGKFKKIVIKGNISGGIGAGSGSIDVTNAGGKIDSITVGGNVTGGIGDGSGFIDGGSSLGTAEIGGSITGGLRRKLRANQHGHPLRRA